MNTGAVSVSFTRLPDTITIAPNSPRLLANAKRQPAAIDLRMVLTVVKVVNELERIGDEIKKIAYKAQQMQRPERLSNVRFHEITRALDEGRLATEVAMWAEKSDITEELARLRAHMGELARLLDEGGAVGRTLDFLIQEMNREVNTVGSKADDLELSQAAIAAKSTLEKLREQAQNIE